MGNRYNFLKMCHIICPKCYIGMYLMDMVGNLNQELLSKKNFTNPKKLKPWQVYEPPRGKTNNVVFDQV